MAAINLGTASPTEGEIRHMDLKQATIQVEPVQLETPATTPEQNSPSEEHTMAGKKIFSLEQPTDKARELAAKLTLEEQVRNSLSSIERAWAHKSIRRVLGRSQNKPQTFHFHQVCKLEHTSESRLISHTTYTKYFDLDAARYRSSFDHVLSTISLKDSA